MRPAPHDHPIETPVRRTPLKIGTTTATTEGRARHPEALLDWVPWARHCRLEPFVKLHRAIINHWDAITAATEHGFSNGLVESMNTKIRLITRIASGFKDPAALIAFAMLHLGGHRPHLPGRQLANR